MSQDWTLVDVLEHPGNAMELINRCLANAIEMQAEIEQLQVIQQTLKTELLSRVDKNIKLVKQQAEIERLQAIVDKLPKTADGVPVLPGITLWDKNLDSFPIEWVSLDNAIDGPGRAYDYKYSSELPLERCYSTREAAEAARGE